MKKLLVLVLLAICLVLSGCKPGPSPTSAPAATAEPTATSEPSEEVPTDTPPPPTPVPEEFGISSAAFEDGGQIPLVYSCDGDNVSPELAWVGVPADAASLVLLVDDPDADGFVHWVVYNVPPTATGLPEDVPGEPALDDGTLQGSNDFALFAEEGEIFPGGAPIKLVGYDGPCPGNEHRYVFALYALDTTLDLPAGATMAEVVAAMEGHVLAQAELLGLYAPPE